VPCCPESAHRGPCWACGAHVSETVPVEGVEGCTPCNGSSELCQVRKEATVLSRTCAVARCNWSRRQSTTPGACATSAQRTAFSSSYLRRRAVTTQRTAMPSPLPIQPIASLPVTLTSTSVDRSPSRRASLLCIGAW